MAGELMRFSLVVRVTSQFVLALVFVGPASGHGDIHERIQDLTVKMESDGGTSALYLKRGELHRLHRDWDRALADYAEAEKLSDDLPHLPYLKGRLWLEAGQPAKAVPYLDAFLERTPRHVDALLVRSRSLGKMGRFREAVSDLDTAIPLHSRPTPEYFLERAQLQIRMGDVPAALRGLDAGLERLGPIVSLIDFAIDLEVEDRRYEPALERLDSLPLILRKQPAWIARGAGILVQAGRSKEAVQEYQLALQAIDDLPPHRSQARAFLEVREQILEHLVSLAEG